MMKNDNPIIAWRPYPPYVVQSSDCRTARAATGTRIVHHRPRSDPASRAATNTVSKFAKARRTTVPSTATTIKKTPRIRVRASPRPATTARRNLPGILQALRGGGKAPQDDIVVVQRRVVRRDGPVGAVDPVLPVPASLTVHRTVDGRHEDALRNLVGEICNGKSELCRGLKEEAEHRVVVRGVGSVANRPAGPFHVEPNGADRVDTHGCRLKENRRAIEARDRGHQDRREEHGLCALGQPRGHGGTSRERGPRRRRRLAALLRA